MIRGVAPAAAVARTCFEPELSAGRGSKFHMAAHSHQAKQIAAVIAQSDPVERMIEVESDPAAHWLNAQSGGALVKGRI